jgi:hypothetical protein
MNLPYRQARETGRLLLKERALKKKRERQLS